MFDRPGKAGQAVNFRPRQSTTVTGIIPKPYASVRYGLAQWNFPAQHFSETTRLHFHPSQWCGVGGRTLREREGHTMAFLLHETQCHYQLHHVFPCHQYADTLQTLSIRFNRVPAVKMPMLSDISEMISGHAIIPNGPLRTSLSHVNQSTRIPKLKQMVTSRHEVSGRLGYQIQTIPNC